MTPERCRRIAMLHAELAAEYQAAAEEHDRPKTVKRRQPTRPPAKVEGVEVTELQRRKADAIIDRVMGAK